MIISDITMPLTVSRGASSGDTNILGTADISCVPDKNIKPEETIIILNKKGGKIYARVHFYELGDKVVFHQCMISKEDELTPPLKLKIVRQNEEERREIKQGNKQIIPTELKGEYTYENRWSTSIKVNHGDKILFINSKGKERSIYINLDASTD